MHVLQSKENLSDSKFLKYCISKTDIEPLLVGGGRAKLNSNIMMSLSLKVPIKKEQDKIGTLFYEIDNLITLHQRKYSKELQTWEQRKLGDVIEDYVEKTTIQNQYPVLTSSQQYGIVLQEDYFANRQVTTDNNIGYFVLPKGYFTYRSRSDSNLFVFNRNNLINKGIISYYYPVFSSGKSDSNFLLRRLNYGIEDQLTMAAEGTGQRVLNHSSFKKVETHFPSNNEQIKIGLLFEKVDNLITLHQHQ